MPEQMPIQVPPTDATQQAPANSMLQIGTGQGQIPIDPSSVKDGSQVQVLLSCNVNGGALEFTKAEVQQPAAPPRDFSKMKAKDVSDALDQKVSEIE